MICRFILVKITNLSLSSLNTLYITEPGIAIVTVNLQTNIKKAEKKGIKKGKEDVT
jgi:hypothetical protein